MNTALKHWKEAATLILAAGHRLRRTHTPPASCFDYDVLMLKRSSKSGFMPNAYVFPGGMLDSSDFSSEWLDIFKDFSNSPSFGLRRVKQRVETRPPIFATDRLKLGSPIPGEVAFRICALRETFEESGVLLVVSKPEENTLFGRTDDMFSSYPAIDNKANELCSDELSRWRTLVNQNPSNFVRMCRELEVLPNIWALHEWSNWLTPAGTYGGTRFDTAFFICCLQEIPHTLQDQREIVRFQWSTPAEVLQSYQAEEFWIAPPQFYELSRMCRFPLHKDLHKFSSQRATEGCEQWLPVVTKDEHNTPVSLLPGDKLYPMDSSGGAEECISTDRELKDCQDSGLHRMLFLGSHIINLQITIAPKYNHLLPVIGEALPHDLDSQL
uniref:Acyl-coenzyme A diphosphatase NUDT19 n=1 Tax=Mola mola TaxID=94237 RepID=A0A3Q3VQW4_MOLML